jgi:hypothetical protein
MCVNVRQCATMDLPDQLTLTLLESASISFLLWITFGDRPPKPKKSSKPQRRKRRTYFRHGNN